MNAFDKTIGCLAIENGLGQIGVTPKTKGIYLSFGVSATKAPVALRWTRQNCYLLLTGDISSFTYSKTDGIKQKQNAMIHFWEMLISEIVGKSMVKQEGWN